MAPWEKILCCLGCNYIPHDPRYNSAPPTAESTKHLDFILSQGDQYPTKDDPRTPLLLKDYHYHEGIVSVARFGDPTDQHWPVRYFAAWPKGDGTLGGFVEIDEEKIGIAEERGILESQNLSKNDRFYGNCPNHPNLEFYVRFHPLKEKPMFPWEKDPKEKEKKYPWDGHEVPELSKEPFKVWGEIDFDSDDCPYPVTVFCLDPHRRVEPAEGDEGENDWITKIDFDSWPQ